MTFPLGSLRYEGGPGGHLRMEYVAPGMATPFEHNHHECWEELFILEGDCFIADEGVLAPGSAVGHPQEYWHGPFASRRGCLFLVHTDDDRSSSLGSVLFYAGLKRHGIPAELHVYGNGGHGYGLRPVTGSQIASWPDHAAHWGWWWPRR